MQIDPQAFRKALGCFATGATIVTAADAQGTPVGLTANSFSSASLDPPLVLWSLANNAYSMTTFRHAAHFAVHILAADQADLARRFAVRGADKFRELDVQLGPDGTPLLRHYSARLVCRKVYEYEGGDHTIFVGEVVDLDHKEGPGLLFHRGVFRTVESTAIESANDREDTEREAQSLFTDDYLVYLLERSQKQVTARFYDQVTALGGSIAAAKVLVLVAAEEGLGCEKIAELEDFIGFSSAAVIDELTEHELIEVRSPDGQPRLWLTPQGRERVMKVLTRSKAVEADACADFSSADLRLLKRLLRRLVQATYSNLPELIVRTSTTSR